MKEFSTVARIIAILTLVNSFFTVLPDRCCQINRRGSPVHKLSRHGKRSVERIISRKFIPDVDKCESFAVSKRALAFNYRQSENLRYEKSLHWNHENCQALECPVINESTKLSNDTSFDYYSIYRSAMSSENGSLRCLPQVGVFHVSVDKRNYTNARESCKKMGATLAHVVSEERTEGLGKMISRGPTFVGLSNRDGERIWKNEFDEPLSCFDYRGWAEGEPLNSRGCVVLVSPNNSHSSATWRVTRCSHELPYICEIMPRSRRHRHHRETLKKDQSRSSRTNISFRFDN